MLPYMFIDALACLVPCFDHSLDQYLCFSSLCCSLVLDADTLYVLCWTQVYSASNASVSLYMYFDAWMLHLFLIHVWSMLHALIYHAFNSLHAYLSGCWARISLRSLLWFLSMLDANVCCILCWTQLRLASNTSTCLLILEYLHDALISCVCLIHACMLVSSPLCNYSQVCLALYLGFMQFLTSVPPRALDAGTTGIPHRVQVVLASNTLVEFLFVHTLQMLYYLGFYLTPLCMLNPSPFTATWMHASVIFYQFACYFALYMFAKCWTQSPSVSSIGRCVL